MKEHSYNNFTLFATSNYMPIIRCQNDAISRRTISILMPAVIQDIDERKKDRLMMPDSLSAVLGWMVEGAKVVVQRGKLPPLTEAQVQQSQMRAMFISDSEDMFPADYRSGKNAARNRIQKTFQYDFKMAIIKHLEDEPDGARVRYDKKGNPELYSILCDIYDKHDKEPDSRSIGKIISKMINKEYIDEKKNNDVREKYIIKDVDMWK